MARTASDRAALMSESPGNDGETPAAATAKTAPLPIRKRQPMARAMARQLKPPITILPAMQLPREMKQHRSRRHPCKIFDDSSQTTSSAAAPMRHSSIAITSPSSAAAHTQHHRPRHLHDNNGRDSNSTLGNNKSRGCNSATTTTASTKKNNGRGSNATLSTAASTRHHRPWIECDSNSRGSYEITASTAPMQHFRPRHLRDIIGRGSNATSSAILNIVVHSIYTASS
eukprot:CAMPEP_0202030992 /NCGR_PEP_ID=MMETSP0905-20130828/64782_1 /ASSEMBLY_ACC=CAM_ASM_000554 /TAXON_ID=420261 /ORGANISM="Thalassiosira antarctica, Strain CCMP982" /LENGTH=227 /DNA_ID=CAMNT_0048594809 /DNA_START=741 /DNA_END=1422 /DNA_ORIENTATION=-